MAPVLLGVLSTTYRRFIRGWASFLANPAPIAEIAHMADMPWTHSKKIGIQRQDDIGPIHAVVHLKIFPKRQLGSRPVVLVSDRLIPMPLRRGISLQEYSKLMSQSG